jgi:hypothetical protein
VFTFVFKYAYLSSEDDQEIFIVDIDYINLFVEGNTFDYEYMGK